MTDDIEAGPAAGDCLACRASGQAISNLGGERRAVTCPWCDGGGVRLAGHDAQARWRELSDRERPLSSTIRRDR